MYVLGLDPLVDEEGAYFAGKDLEKETSGFGTRTLLPDLYKEFGESRKDFEAKFGKIPDSSKDDRKLKKAKHSSMEPGRRARELEGQTGQPVGSLGKSDSRDLNKDSRAMQAAAESSSMESLPQQAQGQTAAPKQSSTGARSKIGTSLPGGQGPPGDTQVAESGKRYVSRKREVHDEIAASKAKMDKAEATLMAIKETNRYFYRLTSPSPYMVAQ